MDDDGTGWNEVLLATWSPQVRQAVVDRVQAAMTGRRGALVRALRDPDAARYEWTESLHRAVVAAIRDETGADLDGLGSQAAWACYEEVWSALADVWRDGGALTAVPLGQEPEVTTLLAALPPEVAEVAGADVSTGTADPLWVAGRLLVDVDALTTLVSGGALAGADLVRLELLVERATGRRR